MIEIAAQIQEVPPGLMKQIYQYGALPLLLLAIYLLWRKNNEIEAKLDKLHLMHKTDLKTNAEEVKALVQDTVMAISKIETKL